MNKYDNYQRNHVIFPGSETELEKFVNATLNGKKHKLKNAHSSNSEDALTWSCFDVLRNQPDNKKIQALNEILEDSFDGKIPFSFEYEQNINIQIGKRYTAKSLKKAETTEVDASIETDSKLIFFEAKLYSLISFPDKKHDYNQIATKLRVGLEVAKQENKEFYFIFLDIAPRKQFSTRKLKSEAEQKSHKYEDKWKSAWWFNYYKLGRNRSMRPLKEVLTDIPYTSVENVANNMGWLTWPCLFKTVLRAVI
jgi:hypothetical protein